MLKKFLLVIMCVFLVDAKVDVKKAKIPTSQYIESNTKLMKAGDVKFGVGAIAGAFSTTNATVGTEMLTVDLVDLAGDQGIVSKESIAAERSRCRTKNANSFAPGGELFVRYMLTGNGFIGLNGSWQYGSKKLKFRDQVKSESIDLKEASKAINDLKQSHPDMDDIVAFRQVAVAYMGELIARYPNAKDALSNVNPRLPVAVGYGPIGYAKLRGCGQIVLDLGYFVGPRVALIGNVGLALHSIKFSMNGVKSSSKTATGLVVGGGIEFFANRHLAIVANAGYMYTRKKIESLQNKIRGVNFSAKIRYYI